MFQNYVVGALVAYAASAIDLANESLAQTDSTLETERTQYPDDNCCFLYPEQDYQGQMREECENEKFQPWTILQRYNYRYTNSYRCGKNAKLSTCDEDASKVQCEDYNNAYIASSSGSMSVRKFGSAMKNDIWSYKVEYYDSDSEGAATLFQGSDCAGYSSSFEYDPTNTREDNASEYLRQEMYDRGHMDGWARSLYVPPGYQVEMFPEDNFVGESWIVLGQAKKGYSKCESTDYPYSLKIRKLPEPGIATGQWVRISSENEGVIKINVKTSVTRSSSTNEETKNTVGSTISGSVGMSYGGVEASLTYSHTDTTEALKAAKASMSQIQTLQKVVTCADDGNIGASIWQWTVTSPNGAETLNTFNFICRTDIDHRMKPACLPALCKNKWCSECRESTTL